ncbi:MAG: sigma-70 family RNA polymerase sigma factor [Gemmatimonadaceae bacterium]
MVERELIALASRGDARASAEIYERYSARVYTLVRRLAGSDAEAEDWAQDAWVRVLRALPRFRGDAQLGSWIHRVALNTALSGRRRFRRTSGREEPLPPSIAAPGDGEEPLLRVRLEAALDQLPEGMRRVLVLHDVEGHTHEEIATLLGTSPSTSRSQLGRARARMRSLLDGDALPRATPAHAARSDVNNGDEEV